MPDLLPSITHRFPGHAFVALTLVACGGAATDDETGESVEPADTAGDEAPGEAAATGSSPAAVNMQRHFIDVQAARDAIISGDLESYRAAMNRIADTNYGTDFPPDWQMWVAEMQGVARESAWASDVDAAATAIASLGTKCGGCHRDTAGGPDAPEEESEPEVDESAGPVSAQMQRHAWATDQLWVGLTGPSHTAWVRGARAIADPGETRGTGMGQALTGLQEYAARASLASRGNREEMYAEILSRCASCHMTHGVGPGR